MVRQIARRKNRQPAKSGNGNLRLLTTLPAVIKELDGLSGVAQLTGKKAQHVWNWKDKGKFPPSTFLIMRDELNRKGFDAPPELWRITSVATRRE